MSEYFAGITFPWQRVTPSDDAIIRRTLLADGILSGCELSYSGSTLTMGAGLLIACGRQLRHTAVQNWAVVGATSGYARLVLSIDTTRTSTKEDFDQIVDSIEYASSRDGFTELQQADINESGTIYQLVACVVSLGAGGITGIVEQVGKTGSYVVPVTLAVEAWTASETAGYVQSVTVPGLTDAKRVKVYPAWPDTLAEKLAISAETAKVRSCVRDGGRMTFECWEDAPTLDISVVVEVVA